MASIHEVPSRLMYSEPPQLASHYAPVDETKPPFRAHSSVVTHLEVIIVSITLPLGQSQAVGVLPSVHAQVPLPPSAHVSLPPQSVPINPGTVSRYSVEPAAAPNTTVMRYIERGVVRKCDDKREVHVELMERLASGRLTISFHPTLVPMTENKRV